MNDELKNIKAVTIVGESNKKKCNTSRALPVLLFFEEAFCTEIMRQVFERSIVKHNVDVTKWRIVESYVTALSFAVNVMMFAVHPFARETKEKYKSITGK